MNRYLLIAILVLLAAAYVGGYWPEHQKLRAAQQSATQAQQQLATLQAVARMSHLENEALDLLGQTENQNYGNARNLSNSFFDELRKEADRDPKAAYKADLESILSQRDTITAGLARADASTTTALHQIAGQMEQVTQKLVGQANLQWLTIIYDYDLIYSHEAGCHLRIQGQVPFSPRRGPEDENSASGHAFWKTGGGGVSGFGRGAGRLDGIDEKHYRDSGRYRLPIRG